MHFKATGEQRYPTQGAVELWDLLQDPPGREPGLPRAGSGKPWVC